MSYFRVSIIGSGNVAWHLAVALENVGHFVDEVYSRNKSNGEALVSRLYNARFKDNLDFSLSNSEVFIVSVSDSAIKELAEKIVLPKDTVLLHTSGSRPMNDLAQYYTKNIGVFYPLQTFSKSKKLDLVNTPICLEAINGQTLKVLRQLAKSLSKKVIEIDSDQRMVLHIAAVFACNFTNHLLGISETVLKKRKLDFGLLKPLIFETVQKSLDIGPASAQTGPARRKDLEILDKHYEYLQYDKNIAEVYRMLSQDIIDKFGRGFDLNDI